MEEYNYTLLYTPRKENAIANCMFRVATLTNDGSLLTLDIFYTDLLDIGTPTPLIDDYFLSKKASSFSHIFLLSYEVISQHQAKDDHFQKTEHSNIAYTIARVTKRPTLSSFTMIILLSLRLFLCKCCDGTTAISNIKKCTT